MRKSKTLAKLRAGSAVRICGLGHFLPFYIRHAAYNRFDCIWLDLEHRSMEDREVQTLLAFFHQFDIDCMVRPPTLEKTRLGRYLEEGASGLMIPHVSTVEKAQMLVQAVKFPPLGDRGLDGAGLDSDFQLAAEAGYPDRANRETFLIVQIETPEAVRNVDAIAAVEGIDGLFVGPADLSLRLKAAESEMTMLQAIQHVAAAADRHGKFWGGPVGDVRQLQEWHSLGARLLAHGGEFQAIATMLDKWAHDFDEVCRSQNGQAGQ